MTHGTEALMTTREAARMLGLSESTLEKSRASGAGPEFVKIGRSIRYHPVAVRAWIDTFPRGRCIYDEAVAGPEPT